MSDGRKHGHFWLMTPWDTVFFIWATLKAAGLVGWSWWFVISPLLISLTIHMFRAAYKAGKEAAINAAPAPRHFDGGPGNA